MLFQITDKTKETFQYIHDSAYLAIFNMAVCPFLYYASGSRDLEEIAAGTFANVIFGLFAGPPIGYSVDTFRDLTGIQSCDRNSYPSLIRDQNPRIKKGLMGLVVAGSTALTVGVYSIFQ
jgi:hypothetical protein